jgi:hypothetical protein
MHDMHSWFAKELQCYVIDYAIYGHSGITNLPHPYKTRIALSLECIFYKNVT